MKKKQTGHLYRLDFADGKSYIGACTGEIRTRYIEHRGIKFNHESRKRMCEAQRIRRERECRIKLGTYPNEK